MPNWKNFCGETCRKCLGDESHIELCQGNVINIQWISTIPRKQNSKDEKQSESFPNYFQGTLLQNKGVLSIISTF